MAAKKAPNKVTKTARAPTPAALLKKVASVSDSTKILTREIKSMTKIFAENQKILVSMKSMIDSLAAATEQVQKQSKQMNMLEEDTQKLFVGLNHVRNQSAMITQINDQSARLEEQIRRIQREGRSADAQKLAEKVSDSMDSIRNNSQMIIKIAQRVDEVRDSLRKVSARTDAMTDVGSELDGMKKEFRAMAEKAKAGSEADTAFLRAEIQKLSQKTESASGIASEMSGIREQIGEISARAEKMDSLGGIIDGLKQQFDTIAAKAESVSGVAAKLHGVQSEMNSLAKSSAAVGGRLESVERDMAEFKDGVLGRTDSIEQKISSLTDMARRSDAAASEFHKKTDAVFQEIREIRHDAGKTAGDSSMEIMALLKLSEYQSSMRMSAESKYGQAKDLEKMAGQTMQIVNLFDGISVQAREKIPLPHEVRQWAVSKILDCADRWEVRFSDVLNILIGGLGRDLLKEAVRIRQVRDIYGIRAVDEIRGELNIS